MKRILLLTFATLLMVACGPSREERISQIRQMEDSLFNSTTAADPNAADQLTKLYVAFADKFPTDSLAPQYLLKAGEVQANVLHTDRAVELLDRVINEYPDFSDVAVCHFLKGNAYDLNGRYDEAKAAYREFVDKYPDHYLADGARQLIPRIGMSPEEMLADILANANDSSLVE